MDPLPQQSSSSLSKENLPFSHERNRENEQAPGKWNQARIGKKSNAVPLDKISVKPSFEVHQDEGLSTSHKYSTPSHSTQHHVLSSKKPENETPLALFEPPDPTKRPMYCKHLVYQGNVEYSFEELRAIKVRKKYEQDAMESRLGEMRSLSEQLEKQKRDMTEEMERKQRELTEQMEKRQREIMEQQEQLQKQTLAFYKMQEEFMKKSTLNPKVESSKQEIANQQQPLQSSASSDESSSLLKRSGTLPFQAQQVSDDSGQSEGKPGSAPFDMHGFNKGNMFSAPAKTPTASMCDGPSELGESTTSKSLQISSNEVSGKKSLLEDTATLLTINQTVNYMFCSNLIAFQISESTPLLCLLG